MPTWKTIAPLLIVGALAAALYAPTLGYPLLASYDDPIFLTNVPFVHERSLENLKEVLLHPVFGAHHPLHQISYALDAALLGDRPFAFHAGNVLLYGILAASVVVLARALGRGEIAACAAGLVFLAHPAHVENVAWVSARKDILSGALVLLSLAVYVKKTPPSRSAIAGSLGLLALALLAKSTAAMIAPLLLVRALLERRFDRKEALRILPFAALGAIALAVHARAQAAVGAAVGPHGGSWPSHARVVMRGLAHYVETALVPTGLTPRPSFPDLDSFAGDMVSVLVLALAGLGFALAMRNRRGAAFPVAIFFLTLAPVANVAPLPAFVHDRYLLLPTVGLALLAGDATETLGRSRRVLAFAALGAVFAAFSLATLAYERAWRSDVDLWSFALERDPGNLEVLERAGAAELDGGPEHEAHGERLLRSALERDPRRLEANVRLGLRELERGNLEKAREHMKAAGAGGSNVRYRAFVLLGEIDLARDDVAEADHAFEEASAIAPRSPEVLAGMGRRALVHGRAGEALSRYDAAIEAESAWGNARVGRARALRALGRLDEASAELVLARTRRAPSGELAAATAEVALDRNDLEAAEAALERAPASGPVLVARARLAAKRGNAELARSLVLEAVARSGPGSRREALAEHELAALLGEETPPPR